jgi:hypothetical protein
MSWFSYILLQSAHRKVTAGSLRSSLGAGDHPYPIPESPGPGPGRTWRQLARPRPAAPPPGGSTSAHVSTVSPVIAEIGGWFSLSLPLFSSYWRAPAGWHLFRHIGRSPQTLKLRPRLLVRMNLLGKRRHRFLTRACLKRDPVLLRVLRVCVVRDNPHRFLYE